MSKKKRNKGIRMSDAAEKAMNQYGKEVHDSLDANFRDPSNPHNITVQSLSAHFAKDGFKKGYDYGRREEREKAFNPIMFIKQFGNEASELARKYGLCLHISNINMEAPACRSCQSNATVNVGIHCFGTTEIIKEAFVNWKD